MRGWKEVSPGMFVPDPPTDPSHWRVSQAEMDAIVEQFGSDEFKAFWYTLKKCDNCRA